MRQKSTGLVWFGALGLLTSLLSAQVMPGYVEKHINPNDTLVHANVQEVILDVGVKDANGGFPSDLKQDNFQVYEDGKLQKITTFTGHDVPVTVGLVVDNSGSMRAKRPDVVTAALTFAKESNPQDEVFVVNFNDHVSMGLPQGTEFTSDLTMLRQGLLNNPVEGRTALYDALIVALQHLEKGRYGKKTLVLISDGGDNASQHTMKDVVKMAEETIATIYTVGIYDSADRDANPGVLKELANLTGGQAFFPERLDQMVDVCRQIAKDIRNRYTIGYIPTNTNYDGKVRKLKVVASAPDHGKLMIRTRTSYIATPPDSRHHEEEHTAAPTVKPEATPAAAQAEKPAEPKE